MAARAVSTLRSAVRAVLPRPVRVSLARAADAVAWRCRCDALDALDALAGRRDPLLPPRRMWELVTGRDVDFVHSGRAMLDLMRAQGLAPDHAVLEVGCGVGRAAIPLTAYLSEQGSYDGLDLMPVAIDWCRCTISPRFPRFRFHLADVKSDRYNPKGATPASRYAFPLPDDRFDFVFLGSVFTHMLPADVANYVREIVRVLKPGGRCVTSCFLIDDETRAGVAKGGTAFDFSVAGEGYRAQDPALHEATVAYERADFEGLYAELGLEIVAFERGAWSRSSNPFQDIVVARRAGLA
jgi:SAM-dependent methyltransferase